MVKNNGHQFRKSDLDPISHRPSSKQNGELHTNSSKFISTSINQNYLSDI